MGIGMGGAGRRRIGKGLRGNDGSRYLVLFLRGRGEETPKEKNMGLRQIRLMGVKGLAINCLGVVKE